MIDYYLKFDDQEHFYTVLTSLNLVYVDDNSIVHPILSTYEYVMCEVGRVINTGGWHVNLRVIDPTFNVSPFTEYMVYPKTPSCVWA